MAYASEEDIERLYPGQLDLVAQADGARDGPRIARALDDATALVNAYVARRFPLPLSAVPAVLVTATVDLALARLAASADVATDEVRRRHDDAMALLRDLAAGRAALDLPAAAPEALSPDLAELDAPQRHFRRSGPAGLGGP